MPSDKYDEAAAMHIYIMENGLLSYSCPVAEPWATLMKALYTLYGTNIGQAREALATAMRGAQTEIGECYTISQSLGLAHGGLTNGE